MAEYQYAPKGTCSKFMVFELDGDTLTDVQIFAGCPGNLQGIMSLLRGMKVQDVIDRFEGIDCGGRGTSCPDQIAKGLKQALQEEMASQPA